MVRVILALLVIGVTIYGLIDCLGSSDDEAQLLPRQVWCLITLVPAVGSIAWLAFGRVRTADQSPGQRRLIAPDDDLDFLRSLDSGFRERRRRAAEDARQRRRQEEARRREAAEREAQGGSRPDGRGGKPNGKPKPNGGRSSGGSAGGEQHHPGGTAPSNRPDGEDHNG
jgi:hypothetical protein